MSNLIVDRANVNPFSIAADLFNDEILDIIAAQQLIGNLIT